MKHKTIKLISSGNTTGRRDRSVLSDLQPESFYDTCYAIERFLLKVKSYLRCSRYSHYVLYVSMHGLSRSALHTVLHAMVNVTKLTYTVTLHQLADTDSKVYSAKHALRPIAAPTLSGLSSEADEKLFKSPTLPRPAPPDIFSIQHSCRARVTVYSQKA